MKNSTKGALIVTGMALVMTVSLVGGYKFITHLSPKVKTEFDSYTNPITEQLKKDFDIPEKEKEEPKEDPSEYVYKGSEKRTYDGPVIYQNGGYIFNSDGKMLTDFRGEKGYDVRLTKSIDGSRAVLVEDDKCVYIDADLNTTEISNTCRLAGMSFDGKYFFHLEQEDSGQAVYIRDIDNEDDYLIAKTPATFRSVCISPDGKTLVYSFYSDKTTIFVQGIDIQEKKYETDDCDSIITVSNDGETIFYSSYDKETEYHCIHQGKITDLGTKNFRHDYLDRECKQILYQDRKGNVKYYRAGDKKPVTLLKEEDARIKLGCVAAQQQDIYMEDYVLDTDSFADAVMIEAEYKCYALSGKTPEVVEMSKGLSKVYSYETCVTPEGPACICKIDGEYVKLVYDGKDINRTPVYECERTTTDITCSDDLTKVWVRDGNNIYYIEDGKEPVLVFELEGGAAYTTYDLDWDPATDRCCFVVSSVMYSVGTTADSRVEMNNCKFFSSYSTNECKVLTVYGTDGNTYIVVGGQAYKLH